MARFLLICLGGAVGTGARYLFSTAMKRAFGNFPFGTLGVNVIGSFLASIVMVLALEKSALSPDMRLILVTGVLGGFTTYSSFNYETLHLAQSGAVTLAIVNVLVTLVTCMLAGIGGVWLARQLG
ncbi:MAG TPA: fluoride efflux transporter CrcB [Polyangia bacterium]|jgi:CrcB protein